MTQGNQGKEFGKTVKQIRQMIIDGIPEHHVRYKFRDFAKAMPHLFNAAINKEFDLKYLDMMLEQMSVVQKSGNTDEAFDEADKVVIGKLRETYVDPLIAAAPKTDTPQEPTINIAS